MNKNLEKFAQKIYYGYPFLRPLLASVYRKFLANYTFSGWGMQTVHELPWNGTDEEHFRNTCLDFKSNFKFTPNSTGTDSFNADEVMWRHWIVTFSARYALNFSNSVNYNFVECGVGDGMSAFFALNEMKKNINFKDCKMYLYDSWSSMQKNDLTSSELSNVGRYHNLSMDKTKNNLSEFSSKLIFHPGYIPQSFSDLTESPQEIIYLHIDLNATKPTIGALDFFYPKIVKGGIILFDDYGNTGYPDTKIQVDKFFQDKSGILMKSPTGQAIYYV